MKLLSLIAKNFAGRMNFGGERASMFFSAIVSLNFFLQQLIQRDILHKKVLRTSEHFLVKIVMVIEIERRDKYLILIFLLWTDLI